MQLLNEWFISAPWGKIALISWGQPKGEPVLLVHGRQDSAATFIPLLELMPQEYYYVAFDLPGHGKSDCFPPGMVLSRIHFVIALDIVVKHFGWKKFVYVSHSMGGEIGLFYNVFRPNKIKKFIFLDIGVALNKICHKPWPAAYADYEHFYSNYADFVKSEKKQYTWKQAIAAVRSARDIPDHLAELVLSRSHREVPFPNNIPYTYNEETGHQEELDQMYTLTWDRRLKSLTHLNLTYDQYKELFTKNMPPVLYFAASESIEKLFDQEGERLIEEMKTILEPDFDYIVVDGNHDVHLTNPERLADDVSLFITKGLIRSKL